MQCEICKKSIHVNYGNAFHIFCKECSINDTAHQIMEKDKRKANTEISIKDNIDIDPPLRTSIIGFLIISAILGLIILLYHLHKHYDSELILTILAGVVLISLITDITKNLYYKKIINNKIIAQSVKNKLNNDLIFGIIILATSSIGFLIVAIKINYSYGYLLQDKHVHKLLYFCVGFVFGISHLHNGLYSNAISKIGILTRGGILEWKEFTSHSWGKYYEEQTFNNFNGYYDLELAHKNGKILTYIFREKESPINLKIRAQDKEKVDKFLSSMIPNPVPN